VNELIQMLVSQLGIDAGQAKGGAGLLFRLAEDKLGGDFSAITKALPQVKDLIQAAPASGGGLGGMLGGLASSLGAEKLGDLAQLAAGFKSLNLDPSLLQQFVPIVLDYVKGAVGPEAAQLLMTVLAGKAS